jgi:putative oxidoreductase
MGSKGLPLVAVLLPITILIELGGGLLLLTGVGARPAAVLLAIFLVPTTLMFHAFWAVAGPERMAEQWNFLRNLAIIGGLVVYATSVRAGDIANPTSIGTRDA